MATLVVSDLHLGTGTGAERLLCPEALAPLLEAIGECDRLVILGDLLELRQGPQWEALAVARPVLKEIAAALPAGGEIMIVPGNHDHRLLRGWFDRRGTTAPPGPLGTATEVEWHPDELLGAVVECLAPAPVRVSYPGVWLRDDVYATYGHYGDRHTVVPMLERLGAGVNARVLREGRARPVGPRTTKRRWRRCTPGSTRSLKRSRSSWAAPGAARRRAPDTGWRIRGPAGALPGRR